VQRSEEWEQRRRRRRNLRRLLLNDYELLKQTKLSPSLAACLDTINNAESTLEDIQRVCGDQTQRRAF